VYQITCIGFINKKIIIDTFVLYFQDSSRAAYEKRQKRRQIRELQASIDKHDADAVREILRDDFDVDFQYRGQTALQLAVREGCYDICKQLIARGANVNVQDVEYNNLLHMACCEKTLDQGKKIMNIFSFFFSQTSI